MDIIDWPEFRGYTVDFRLKEFRKVDWRTRAIEFIPFDSPKGRKLRNQMHRRKFTAHPEEADL